MPHIEPTPHRRTPSGWCSLLLRASLLRISLLSIGLLALAATASAKSPVPPRKGEHVKLSFDSSRFISIDEIRPGMTGYGKTVFSGTTVETFEVEFIDVVRNFIGPRSNVILARISGGPNNILATSKVVAGMSGSPVYVRDEQGRERLAGALAYGWGFSADAICGISPIEEMLEVLERPQVARPIEADSRLTLSREALSSDEALYTALLESTRQTPAFAAGEQQLERISAPLTMAGFSRQALDVARTLLGPYGFEPVAGGSAGSEFTGNLPAYEPGSAVGVVIFGGDMSGAAIGTVTHVEGDRLIAFGHPMMNAGELNAPMAPAVIHSFISLLSRSFKLGTALPPNGTLVQDRLVAVAGKIGPVPSMIPLSIRVDGPSSKLDRPFNFNLMRDKNMAPLLTASILYGVLTTATVDDNEVSLTTNLEVKIRGQEPLTVRRVYSGQAPLFAAIGVMRPLMGLTQNFYQEAEIEHISVTAQWEESFTQKELVSAMLLNSQVRAGGELDLLLKFQDYQGAITQRSLRLPVSQELRVGQDYTLALADVGSFVNNERKRAPGKGDPTSLASVIELLNTEKDQNELMLTIFQNRPGVLLNGQELTNLPPSFQAHLNSPAVAGKIGQTNQEVLVEQRLSFPEVVRGSAMLSFTVQP